MSLFHTSPTQAWAKNASATSWGFLVPSQVGVHLPRSPFYVNDGCKMRNGERKKEKNKKTEKGREKRINRERRSPGGGEGTLGRTKSGCSIGIS